MVGVNAVVPGCDDDRHTGGDGVADELVVGPAGATPVGTGGAEADVGDVDSIRVVHQHLQSAEEGAIGRAARQ